MGPVGERGVECPLPNTPGTKRCRCSLANHQVLYAVRFEIISGFNDNCPRFAAEGSEICTDCMECVP